MKNGLSYSKEYAFNAICPYYTMFPIEYPLHIIKKHKASSPIVLDPFCGRGTTIYAARKQKLQSFGIDTSPIAVAIARAKLAKASVQEVMVLAEELLSRSPVNIPQSEFFDRAYSPTTLRQICALREGLLDEKSATNASSILRAAILGCLHGPLLKSDATPSYLSNQMPRTFASKPDYSVRFWISRGLIAPEVSVLDTLRKKLKRIPDLESDPHGLLTNIKAFDARNSSAYCELPKISLTITSPPYYGMRTYVQDQWLRMWFLGGSESVVYENDDQIDHGGHQTFISELAKVWENVANASTDDAHLYVRFGSISSVKSDAKELLLTSFSQSERWKKVYVRTADTAHAGKRQADQMGRASKAPEEFDFHAVRC